MTWLYFAIVTAIFYGIFDLFVKLTAGKVEDGLAALIINVTSALVLAVWVMFGKFRGIELFASRDGFIYAVIAGLLIGSASITFIKVFSSGSNLSVGVSVVRVGMIMIALLLGFIVLKEKLDLQQVIGVILALGGLTLVLL